MIAKDLITILKQYDGDMPVVMYSGYLKWEEIETVKFFPLANEKNEEVQVLCLLPRKRPDAVGEMKVLEVDNDQL